MSSKLVGANFIWPHGTRKARPYTKPTEDDLPPPPNGERVFTCDPTDPLTIRYAKKGVAARRFETIPKAFEAVCTHAKLGKTQALCWEKPGYPADKEGEWESYTWEQYRTQVRTFARALIASGHQTHQGVAICGFNGPYWFIAHMGCMYARGLSAGTYTTNTPEACKYVADHSKSHVVIVDNVKTLQKYLQISLETVKHIVVANEPVPDAVKQKHGERVLGWAEFMAKATSVGEDQLETVMNQCAPNQCASLIYTSGTTGNPKAVMASHDSMMFAIASVVQSAIADLAPKVNGHHIVSYLPLSHIAAQNLDIVGPIFLAAEFEKGATVHFARPDVLKGSLPITLKAVKPTMFFGVPRVWEKFVEKIKQTAKENPATGVKAGLVDFAKRVGLECSLNRQCGGNGRIPARYAWAEATVFKTLRAKLGFDRCVSFLTGAAPVQRETLNFFASLGIDIQEIYGMSETCGGGTVGSYNRFKFGCCGAPLDGTEMKLDHVDGRDKPQEGEICYRGRHLMMGYLRNEEKSKETIDAEGWLHSGDVGKFDEHTQLAITGRIKELIIGAGGENIAPIPIEDEVKRLCPAISNAIMIGDKRKYNTMLVTLKAKQNLETGDFLDELVGEAKEVNPEVKTVTEAIKDPKWQKHIEDAIKKYNVGPICVSNAQKVQKFKILPTDLSIPGGELTGTLKIKRPVVSEKYANLIEEMYAGGEE